MVAKNGLVSAFRAEFLAGLPRPSISFVSRGRPDSVQSVIQSSITKLDTTVNIHQQGTYVTGRVVGELFI